MVTGEQMLKNKIFVTLLLILILAFSVRIFMLGKIPISLNWDEVTFAYNAYSIAETGKDEYGSSYPLIFKSIGDYKNPLLVYILVPFVKLFGLTEFSIRLPMVLFGVLSVLVIYFVAKLITNSQMVGIFAALFLSISPWHIEYSRAQDELPISFTLVLLGILFFLLSIKKNFRYIFLSAVFFGLTLYSYYADRFFVPAIVLMLSIIFKEELIKKWKYIWPALLLGGLIVIPLVIPFLSSGSQQKILNTTVFGYEVPSKQTDLLYREDGSYLFALFHNPIVQKVTMVVSRYLNHFSPSYLFLEGGEDVRFQIYGMGLLYLFDLPLILIGLYLTVKRRDKFSILLLAWFLVAPLPAAITRDETHARRSFQMIGPLMILGGIGFERLSRWFFEKKRNILYALVFGVVAAFNISFFLISYFIYTPTKNFMGPGGWQYGYKELVNFISPIKNKYDKVIIDTSYQGPYIYFLFYEKYPPSKYQPQAKLIYPCDGCLGEGPGYDKYEFRSIFWPDERGKKRMLFAGPPERIPYKDIQAHETRLIRTISFPNGSPTFLVVESVN